MSELIPLHELNNNTRISIEHLGLEHEGQGVVIKELNFHHIDGAFSYCTDDKKNVFNLRGDTEVKYIRRL